MKKCFIIVLVLCVFILFGCKSNNDRGDDSMSNEYKSIINNHKPLSELSNNAISIDNFGRLNLPYKLQGLSSLALTMDNVKETLGLDCLRENNSSVYSIHRFTNENNQSGYCFITYKSEAVIDSWFVIKIPDKVKFKQVKVNKTSFDDIKQLDPAAIIFDSYTPLSSYHRFSDGTAVEIRYVKNGDTFLVKDYAFENDPVSIVKFLLPIDLNLIK